MKRRTFLHQTGLAATAAAASGFSFNILKGAANPDDLIVGQGDYRYKVHRNWAKISSIQTPLLNCHEMVMDSQGRLHMIGDHTSNNILVFDRSGKLLDAWGTQYPGGHGLTLSKEGEEDFLFIVDCGYFQARPGQSGRQSGRVAKTTLDGRLVFDIGHPATIGVYEDNEPFQPTEVAVAPNGDFYVADGYGSDYILQYDHRGRFIRKFGGHKQADPEHNISNAHGVAVDLRDPNQPKLVVTSRADHRFKYFTLDGQYLSTLHLPGAYVCRPVMDGDNLYAGVCWSVTPDGKTYQTGTGFVTILDKNNKVVSNPGGQAPVYQNGALQPLLQGAGDQKILQHGHDVCLDGDKNIYVCQWNAQMTPPVMLERV